MQYYEIEDGDDNKTLPFLMNQITESKTALAKGLLGFQFLLVAGPHNNFIIQVPPDKDVPSNAEKATAGDLVVRNYIGPCEGSYDPGKDNICNEYKGGVSNATYNVYDDGQQASGCEDPDTCEMSKFAIHDGNKPHTISCTTDDCSKFQAYGGGSSGPGVS